MSPKSSSSNKSPKKKTRPLETQFPICVEGFTYTDQLYHELYCSVMNVWEEKFQQKLSNTYTGRSSLMDDLSSLGFPPETIRGVTVVFDSLCARFGAADVNAVLSTENVGTLAELLLDGMIERYSDDHCEEARKTPTSKELFDLSDSEDDDDSHPPIPSPIRYHSRHPHHIAPMIISPSNVESSTSNATNPDDASTQPDGGGWQVQRGRRKKLPLSRKIQFGRKGSEDDDGSGGENINPTTEEAESPHKKYPEWIIDLHRLATEKGIILYFTDDDPLYSTTAEIPMAPFHPWERVVSTPTVKLYHGCSLLPSRPIAMRDVVVSFLKSGVVRGYSRRGQSHNWMSTRPCVYYSNSLPFSRLWPILSQGIRNYETYTTIPPPSLLVLVTGADSDVLFGNTNDISAARIRQSRKDYAAEVFPFRALMLTCEQFVNRNSRAKGDRRFPIPGADDSTRNADFVHMPLPYFNVQELRGTFVGREIDAHTPLARITVTGSCTEKSDEYLNTCEKYIIIYGYGNGALGTGKSVTEFGTAGISRGQSSYVED